MGIFTHRGGWRRNGAVLLLLLGTAAAQDQSLAEIARQKTGKPAARVITNEDLEATRPAETAAPKVAQPAPAAPADKPAGNITVPGLLEQGTVSDARAILESLRRDEQVLEQRYAQLEQKLRTETNAQLRRLYADSLARRDETMVRKRAQIEEVQKAIAAAQTDRNRKQRREHEPKAEIKK